MVKSVENTHDDLNFVRLNRRGGIAGVDERIEVRPTDGRMKVQQHAFLSEPQEFDLDSVRSAELVELAQKLATSKPAPSKPPRGADMYEYVLEIGWRGQNYEFVVTGAPSDTALHGMIALVAGLLSQTADSPHQLTGHIQ